MLIPVEQLKPYGQNPGRGNVELIADSLRANGQYRPVVVNRRNGARRRSLSMELDPRYVDVICRRWQEHTGQVPVRDGEPVSFVPEG